MQGDSKPHPVANPQYVEDPPAVSKDGKTVRISIEALHRIYEHYRIFGVKEARR